METDKPVTDPRRKKMQNRATICIVIAAVLVIAWDILYSCFPETLWLYNTLLFLGGIGMGLCIGLMRGFKYGNE